MTGIVQSRQGGAQLRRERRARGECILGDGAATFKAGRCQSCYERHRAANATTYVKRRKPIEVVDDAAYMRARAAMLREFSGRAQEPKFISAQIDARLRRDGSYVSFTWTAKQDRREEIKALSEITANRKSL